MDLNPTWGWKNILANFNEMVKVPSDANRTLPSGDIGMAIILPFTQLQEDFKICLVWSYLVPYTAS